MQRVRVLTARLAEAGPLNAEMANVLPAELRTRGFAVTTMLMHLPGDAVSPWLIGTASDRIGLRVPVLVTGCLVSVAGVVLLWGRATLECDLLVAGGSSPGRIAAPTNE